MIIVIQLEKLIKQIIINNDCENQNSLKHNIFTEKRIGGISIKVNSPNRDNNNSNNINFNNIKKIKSFIFSILFL